MVSISILIGKRKFMLSLYLLTEIIYGSADFLYGGDAVCFVPMLASGIGVDVNTAFLHNDEKGARVQTRGKVS